MNQKCSRVLQCPLFFLYLCIESFPLKVQTKKVTFLKFQGHMFSMMSSRSHHNLCLLWPCVFETVFMVQCPCLQPAGEMFPHVLLWLLSRQNPLLSVFLSIVLHAFSPMSPWHSSFPSLPSVVTECILCPCKRLCHWLWRALTVWLQFWLNAC